MAPAVCLRRSAAHRRPPGRRRDRQWRSARGQIEPTSRFDSRAAERERPRGRQWRDRADGASMESTGRGRTADRAATAEHARGTMASARRALRPPIRARRGRPHQSGTRCSASMIRRLP